MSRKPTDIKQKVLKIVKQNRMILQSDIAKTLNKNVNYSVESLVNDGKINRQKVKNRGRVGNLTDVWLVYLNSVKQNEILDYEKKLINKPYKSPLEGNTYKKDIMNAKNGIVEKVEFSLIEKSEERTNELTIMDNKVIPIYNDNNERVVNARELFKFLKGNITKTKFSDWINDRIKNYGFEKNVDFKAFSSKNEKGGRPTIEYYLTMDTAKEIAMVENNDKGRLIRRYFIETEKQFRLQNMEIPTNDIGALKMMINVLEQHENRISSIEDKFKLLAN